MHSQGKVNTDMDLVSLVMAAGGDVCFYRHRPTDCLLILLRVTQEVVLASTLSGCPLVVFPLHRLFTILHGMKISSK